MRDRLASETGEEREARLQQMRDQLASETGEEREARLQQMSAQQRDRLASETAEERDIRLQCYSVRHREQIVVLSQLPLFEQRSVRTKMLRFHAHMASLDSPQCTTCSEMFPSSFAHKILSVCAAVATSTVQRCTLQPTIWTQAPYHPSCRLVYIIMLIIYRIDVYIIIHVPSYKD